MKLTAIVYLDALPSGGSMFTASCPEMDIASQGETCKQALANLREAVEGYLEAADSTEIESRLEAGATVSELEVAA